MKLTQFAVDHYRFTLLIFILLVAIGWNAFQTIPRSEDPTFPIPIIRVIAIYPGANPVDVEQLVIEPIEDALNELDDIKKLTSTIRTGLGMTEVEFEWTSDPEKKYDEVVRQINTLRPKLPQDLTELDIKKTGAGFTNIIQVALVGQNASYRELRDAAYNLHEALKTAPGVRQSDYWGIPAPQIEVAIDLPKLSQLGITLDQVINAIQGNVNKAPGGAVTAAGRRFNIKISDGYDTPEQVADAVVGAADGRIVQVRDVATVSWNYEEETYLARFNGERAVFVTANQKDNSNIFKVRDAISAKLDAFERTLPAHIRLERGFDQSVNVQQRLSRLGYDLMLAVALVMVTLLPLGLRAAGVVAVSIPLSLAIGLALVHWAGFSLNQLSIAGFVVALGLLVDDSIVVIENIERYLRAGYTRIQAVLAATQQITLAVLGCTATLLLAFLPLLFLPEGAGQFIRSLPATVIFTILASLLVALTIIPFLASRCLKEKAGSENLMLRLLMQGIERVYRPLLHVTLTHPRLTLLGAGLIFGASLLLIPRLGFSLFPLADTPQFLISIETPTGSSLADTDRVLRYVEQTLAGKPEVRQVMSNLGKGNPQIYYNVRQRETQSNFAEVFVQTQHYDPVATPALMDQLREQFAQVPGARIIVKRFENGPPLEAPIAIRIIGPQLKTLQPLAQQVEAAIAATPGARDVDNPVRLLRTDLNLGIDARKAGLLGISMADIKRTVRMAIAGLPIGTFRTENGDEFAVTMRLPLQGHPQLTALDSIYLDSSTGAAAPLKTIATPYFETIPNEIQRRNRERSVTVTAYTQSGYNTNAVTQDVLAAVAKLPLPPGYRLAVGGQAESAHASFAGLSLAILIATFGILAVLVLEFQSFKSMLIVAGVIPLGITGGLVALWLTGYSLSFVAVVGFVALVGVEIKNSILLVDFTNQLRAQGLELLPAIEQAGELRFLPILLTSATAIGGLLPLALQGIGLYSPLAWVLIGGLISSTLLARLVTPVMYLLLAPEITGEPNAEPRKLD